MHHDISAFLLPFSAPGCPPQIELDCVTFPVPLITFFIATVDDTLSWGACRAVERDSETSMLAEEVV